MSAFTRWVDGEAAVPLHAEFKPIKEKKPNKKPNKKPRKSVLKSRKDCAKKNKRKLKRLPRKSKTALSVSK